jgi:hypothetical protein
MSDENLLPRPRPDLVETEIGTEISIYDPAAERVTLLNQTASDIWRLVDGATSVDEIADLLGAAYDTPAKAIQTDVHAAISSFRAADLLEDVR